MGALLLVPEAIARAEALRNNAGQTVDMPTWKVGPQGACSHVQPLPLLHWQSDRQCCVCVLSLGCCYSF